MKSQITDLAFGGRSAGVFAVAVAEGIPSACKTDPKATAPNPVPARSRNSRRLRSALLVAEFVVIASFSVSARGVGWRLVVVQEFVGHHQYVAELAESNLACAACCGLLFQECQNLVQLVAVRIA